VAQFQCVFGIYRATYVVINCVVIAGRYNREVGIGARVFLPIFGLLGLDYGYGFDKIPGIPDANKGQFSFSISQSLSGGFN